MKLNGTQKYFKEVVDSLNSKELERRIHEYNWAPLDPIYTKLSANEKLLFSEAIQCTPNGARNIAKGRTIPGIKKAELIQELTGGLVTVKMLRWLEG